MGRCIEARVCSYQFVDLWVRGLSSVGRVEMGGGVTHTSCILGSGNDFAAEELRVFQQDLKGS